MKEPVWVLEQVAYSIHSEQIAEHGGADGVRDKGLLISALDAPRQLFHYKQSNLSTLAATYAYRIINNHPFIDGNKRTGYIVSRLFLMLNGHDIEASEEERATVFLKIADNIVTETELIHFFDQWIV